ncbi:MAG: hypothetical protein ACXWP4_06970, partial [Polyangiales bacterium]
MNTKIHSLAAVLAVLTLGTACAAPTASPGEKGAPAGSQGASPVSASSLAVEQAIRDLDVGRDPASAKKKLEEALLDPTLPDGTRDVGSLGLARALDRTGDKEQAIKTVEALVAKHVDDHPWGLEEQADELLQTLVTGAVHHAQRDDSGPSAAPIAKALARYFTPKDGKVVISQFFVGGSGASERLGTFDIAQALREKKRESCPLCDDKVGAHTKTSRSSSWTRIPAERAKYDEGLVVFYFDLEARTIPARYDELLPMPSAEVIARLSKGEGVIAVKQRENAPPMILIAAPRDAQLAEVEESFAQMKDLPSAPVSVAVSPRVRPNEIKSVFRAAKPAYRACAEALFARTPGVS